MLKSLDTNILIYALDRSCKEHKAASNVIDMMLGSPNDWIIADQVLWEYYNAMRNPAVFSEPLTPTQAVNQIKFIREESGVLHCAYETSLYTNIIKQLENSNSPRRRVYDLVLATTLIHNSVSVFYTRNIKDFDKHGFDKIINPIDT